MLLSNDEMDAILDDLTSLLMSDPDIVSIEIEHSGDGNDPRVLVRHLHPEKAKLAQQSYELRRGNRTLPLAIAVVQGEPIVPELAGPSDRSIFDDMEAVPGLAGQGGTKISRPSGSWGTLCLSGANVRATFGAKTCTASPFVFTNSHVGREVGTLMSSFGVRLGTVDDLFSLEHCPSFDYSQLPWTENHQPENHFRVYEKGNPAGRSVVGLRVVTANAAIAKQGARTGWSEGQASGKAKIKLKGHAGCFRCWKGTYKSKGGDSGSPVLQLLDGEWNLVGIHFASGPHFAGWDVIGPGSGNQEIAIEAQP